MKPNMIGAYGPWAASLVGDDPPRLSFRREGWRDVDAWRATARARLLELLAQPDTGGLPDARVQR
ncbi:MAG: hypothetical protein FJZ90_10120, partial [Chloroflexi bacterium]|nr:hypothetical protein [Chloroflexota bacterium]